MVSFDGGGDRWRCVLATKKKRWGVCWGFVGGSEEAVDAWRLWVEAFQDESGGDCKNRLGMRELSSYG